MRGFRWKSGVFGQAANNVMTQMVKRTSFYFVQRKGELSKVVLATFFASVSSGNETTKALVPEMSKRVAKWPPLLNTLSLK